MEQYRSGHNGHDWKSCVPQKGTEGSNPSCSARKTARQSLGGFYFTILKPGTIFRPGLFVLQQPDPGLFAGLYGSVIPDAGLNLANVGAAQHQHGKSALADAAADGQGQLTV